MAIVTLRYDLRSPPFAASSMAERYRVCLEQCTFADAHGIKSAVISEHHGVDDGYLSSPLVLAAAILGRTSSMRVSIQALLLPLHDPLRVAEDIAALDLMSHGRIMMVAGLGYRDEEFEMFGVDRARRGKVLDEKLGVLLQAWTGEPFTYNGRKVRVTPRPYTQPHPLLFVGGSTKIAAQRAARNRLPFMPAIGDPALADLYREACEAEGYEGGFVVLPSGPGFVHVTDDPERAWAEIAPFALHDAKSYHGWQRPGQRSSVDTGATTIEELKDSGVYWVITPEECIRRAKELGRYGAIVLHPLMGGMDPSLGWQSVELFVDRVLPQLKMRQ